MSDDVVENMLVGRLEEAVAHMTDREREDLAVDFVTGKGEKELVHRLFHTMRRRDVDVVREDLRRDLVIEGGVVEFKVMHLHLVFSPVRVDRAFNDFARKSGDLKALVEGRADLLVAVVPRLVDTAHRTYPASVNQQDPARLGIDDDELDGRLTAAAETWADEQSIRLRCRLPISLQDESVGRVDVTLLGFARL